MSFYNGSSTQFISQSYNFELLDTPTSSPSFPNNSYLKPEPDRVAAAAVIVLGIISVILTLLFFCCRRICLGIPPEENKYGLAYYDYAAIPDINSRNERAVILHNSITTSLESDMNSKVLAIHWSDIKAYSLNPKETIVGRGSFGVVFRAILQTHIGNEDIVVKVIKQTGKTDDDHNLIKTAFEECRIIKEAESKMIYKSCIVKVYGIANGSLPSDCADVMNIQSAIGIVMRYEGGGTLTKRIHPSADLEMGPSYLLDMKEKIRLITGLARGLVELHSAGIVHGDIKPDNVLLSSDDPPEVRLADFGLARIREEYDMGASSLHETKHAQGTLLYCAPEMMVNPYEDEVTAVGAVVAKASRKSDMYAFAVVSWEILTGLKPFGDVRLETTLAMKVHQGERPPLSKIPTDCPKKVIDMIQLCWDRDRFMRESAVKCFSKLQYEYRQLTNSSTDICLSYHESNRAVCEYYYQRLTQLGCKVCILEQDNEIHENLLLLTNCQIVIVFLNISYQNDINCMDELKRARQLNNPYKIVIAIFTESNYMEWADLDIYYLCQLRSQTQRLWDVSDVIIDTNNTNLHNRNTYISNNRLNNTYNIGETDEDTVDHDSSYHQYNHYIDEIKFFIDEILKLKRKKQIEKFDLKLNSTSIIKPASSAETTTPPNDFMLLPPPPPNFDNQIDPSNFDNSYTINRSKSTSNIHNTSYRDHNWDEKAIDHGNDDDNDDVRSTAIKSPVHNHNHHPISIFPRHSLEITNDTHNNTNKNKNNNSASNNSYTNHNTRNNSKRNTTSTNTNSNSSNSINNTNNNNNTICRPSLTEQPRYSNASISRSSMWGLSSRNIDLSSSTTTTGAGGISRTVSNDECV